MKIINQSWTFQEDVPDKILEKIEHAGRTCYQSHEKITKGSSQKFVKMLIKNGHHSVLEHVSIGLNIITNRGVMSELTRHRLSSFSIESTRYVSYKNDMIVIRPVWWDSWDEFQQDEWAVCMKQIEKTYRNLIYSGATPEKAREVLPNALKTSIIITANIREWMHILDLRCSKKAHPQMRSLMLDILKSFHKFIPIIFDDIAEKHLN